MTITFRGQTLSFDAFDTLVLNTVPVGHLTNAYVAAYYLRARNRANVAASLERLVAAGSLVREDLAVTNAAPVYRRIR
jgi:hypothetical protein